MNDVKENINSAFLKNQVPDCSTCFAARVVHILHPLYWLADPAARPVERRHAHVSCLRLPLAICKIDRQRKIKLIIVSLCRWFNSVGFYCNVSIVGDHFANIISLVVSLKLLTTKLNHWSESTHFAAPTLCFFGFWDLCWSFLGFTSSGFETVLTSEKRLGAKSK